MDNDELKRVLRLVKEGKLSEAQAESIIAAIQARTATGPDEGLGEPERREKPRGERGTRRHGRHRRSRKGAVLDDHFVGDQVARVIDKSMRGATSALRHAGRLGPVAWLNDSNVSILSRLEEPIGDDYTCRDNNINVSQIRDLVFSAAAFCDNELNASAIKDISINDGEFRGNEMHGSSLKQLSLTDGGMVNCDLNGAQISTAIIAGGKLADCTFNGAHVRELSLKEADLEEAKFNGSNVTGLNVGDGAGVKQLAMNGTRCRNLSIEGGEIDDLRFSGLKVESCHIKSSSLRNVVFKGENWRDRYDDGPRPSVSKLTLDSVTLESVRFVRCRFDRTAFRQCEIRDMTFTGVDFTDMTIDSAESARALADDAVA